MLERLTECECTGPGWCQRHRCEKDQYLFEMCQRLENWFRSWEQGNGFGQHVVRAPNRVQEPCRHLGRELRTEVCATCGGNVKLKVFCCSVHQECTLSSRLPALVSCHSCSDYESSNGADEYGP